MNYSALLSQKTLVGVDEHSVPLQKALLSPFLQLAGLSFQALLDEASSYLPT